jgi:hypothetical protein
MKRINQALTFCSLAMLAFVFSCGHPESLQSITISPASYTATGSTSAPPAGAQNQFTAYGNYIHPTKTVDITSQVAWTSSSVGNDAIAIINSSPQPNPGQATSTGLSCGTTVITATAGKGVIGPGDADEVVTGTATFTATGSTGCAGSEPVLSVNLASISGTGSETVVSGGNIINCAINSGMVSGNCAAPFQPLAQVTLTASVAPQSWSNCTTNPSPTICTVTMPANGNPAEVTATFN